MGKLLSSLGGLAGGFSQSWDRARAQQEEKEARRAAIEENKRQFDLTRQDRKDESIQESHDKAAERLFQLNMKLAEHDQLSADELEKIPLLHALQQGSRNREMFLKEALEGARDPNPAAQAAHMDRLQIAMDSIGGLDTALGGEGIVDAMERNPVGVRDVLRDLELRNAEIQRIGAIGGTDNLREKLRISMQQAGEQMRAVAGERKEQALGKFKSMLKPQGRVDPKTRLVQSLVKKGIQEADAAEAVSRHSKTDEPIETALVGVLEGKAQKESSLLRRPPEVVGVPGEPEDIPPEVLEQEMMRAMQRDREQYGKPKPPKEPVEVGLVTDFKGKSVQLPPPGSVRGPWQRSRFSLKSTPSKEGLLKRLAAPGTYERAFKSALSAKAITGNPDPTDPKVVLKVVNWVMLNNEDDTWFGGVDR